MPKLKPKKNIHSKPKSNEYNYNKPIIKKALSELRLESPIYVELDKYGNKINSELEPNHIGYIE